MQKDSKQPESAGDKTWRMHHMPMWAKKQIRMNAIKQGKWVSAAQWGHTTVESLLPNDLFDHWGSVKRGETRALVAQPYGNHDDLAAKFAAELGWSVKSFTPGPWNDGTWCYEFLPNKRVELTAPALSGCFESFCISFTFGFSAGAVAHPQRSENTVQ